MRNIELKARCGDLTLAAERATALGARQVGVLEQTDTYFHAARGRLKLRESAGRAAELIAYERADSASVRDSVYYIATITDVPGTMRVLESALGVRAVVRKSRILLTWHNVRIHLDTVEGLGTFVEFEAVMGVGENDVDSRARISELAAGMNLGAWESTSYGDLVGGV